MTTKNIHHLIKAIFASAILTLGISRASAQVLQQPSTQSRVNVTVPGDGGSNAGESW